MSSDKISIASIQNKSEEEEKNESTNTESNNSLKDVCTAICISIFGIIAFSTLFCIPWTIIPRTNSIIYQTHWMEAILPIVSNYLLTAGSETLNLATWMQEESLMSISNFLKIHILFVITNFNYVYDWTLVYITISTSLTKWFPKKVKDLYAVSFVACFDRHSKSNSDLLLRQVSCWFPISCSFRCCCLSWTWQIARCKQHLGYSPIIILCYHIHATIDFLLHDFLRKALHFCIKKRYFKHFQRNLSTSKHQTFLIFYHCLCDILKMKILYIN